MDEVTSFQDRVWEYYRSHQRSMPWRDTPSPYYVLVSELMLQQTQVSRVIPKFEAFVERFPDETALARASLADVLSLWNGLGYNRRAKFLHEAAKIIVSQAEFPTTYESLLRLPGVGPNTAAAICNYAYQQPTAFIETNIRSVLFHEFFKDKIDIDDGILKDLVEQTMDTEHPREWFWALMDYGSMLKRTRGGQLDKSRHYKKQSPLQGSVREVRGHIVKVLTIQSSLTISQLRDAVSADERFDAALSGLIKEGLITKDAQNRIGLTGSQGAS